MLNVRKFIFMMLVLTLSGCFNEQLESKELIFKQNEWIIVEAQNLHNTTELVYGAFI